MPALKGFAAWPGQPSLRADLDGKGGLRHGQRLDPGPVLYLPIAPLEQRRRAVIKEFHRGRIVPSLGVAADFRVEEHVAVLEQLRIVFEAPQDECGERGARKATAGPYIDVWVGLSEILARGLNMDSAMTPQGGLAIKGAPSLSDTRRIRQVQFADEYESSRRLLRLADVSDAGYGFDATEKEAAGIGVGDLVGMRLSDDEPCVLGRVVRRVPGQIEGQVTLGVLAISRSPQALTLSRTLRQGRPDDDEAFIYVPGADDSGAQDAFLVPEKSLQEPVSHDACFGEDVFTILFNRVRRKGRGWALAGFEILEAKRVAPSAAVEAVKPEPAPTVAVRAGAYPKFELVEKGDEDDDPWGREVSSRLL
jgi:hypothetical protein